MDDSRQKELDAIERELDIELGIDAPETKPGNIEEAKTALEKAFTGRKSLYQIRPSARPQEYKPEVTVVINDHSVYRSRYNREVGGVIGGICNATGVDTTIPRVAVFLLCVYSPIFIMLYLLLWMAIPLEDETKELKRLFKEKGIG